uniref:Uncharacterized protein n=1 Tax=Euplotes harpa TaxID=151035 RepID=A0A7S3JD98_9SPIT|mmetsp:Transcript_34015/g.39268  ORF Transcript_34015/g.39268 Transcript_34015/m.39268 type:complete len:101 (+) Transcript_34015:223-525(+)
MTFTNKIALVEKDRKQEQKQLTQEIENFRHLFKEIKDDLALIESKQTIYETGIKTNVVEIEKANERIIQAKEISNKAVSDSSTRIDVQIRSIIDDVIELK